MSEQKVLEYRRELTDVTEKLADIRENPKGEGGDLSEDQETEWQNLFKQGKRIKEQHDKMIAEEDLNLGEIDTQHEVDEAHRATVRFEESLGPPEKRFATLGDQMIAVRTQALTQVMDPRLDPKENRAILGMGETIPSDGGFLVQKDFTTEMFQLVHEMGAVSSRVRRLPVGPNANGLKMNAIDETSRASGSRWGGVEAYWMDEGQTKTATKPKLRQMEWTLKKLIALMYATDELIQDATALSAVASAAFTEEMGFQLEDAIINGSGAGDPLGILNSTALITVAKEGSQVAKTIVTNNIIKMRSRMHPKSRANAVWFVNLDVEPELHNMTLVVGTGGIAVWMPAGGLSGQPFDTLFGRPVIPVEYCQTLGTKGDIYFADLSQYGVIEKGGVQAASSIHVQFLTDQMTFRWVMRTDGQSMWSSPLTPKNGSTTTSPFVTLATRG